MDFFRSMAIAFSMYSAVPMPQFQWDQNNYQYAFCFFPLVGAGLSGCLYLLYRGAELLSLSVLAAALIFTGFIVIYTGGFHVDGYMDTMDALCSHRSRDEKIARMKDPHIGAFGVIQLMVLTVFMAAGFYEAIRIGKFTSVLYAFVISRILSGISVCTFKRREGTSSLVFFDEKGSRQTITFILLLYTAFLLILMLYNRDTAAILATAAGVSWLFTSKAICDKEFGGISGDTCGYFLCICEAVFIWTLVIFSLILH